MATTRCLARFLVARGSRARGERTGRSLGADHVPTPGLGSEPDLLLIGLGRAFLGARISLFRADRRFLFRRGDHRPEPTNNARQQTARERAGRSPLSSASASGQLALQIRRLMAVHSWQRDPLRIAIGRSVRFGRRCVSPSGDLQSCTVGNAKNSARNASGKPKQR
jgi:hypothetical protein